MYRFWFKYAHSAGDLTVTSCLVLKSFRETCLPDSLSCRELETALCMEPPPSVLGCQCCCRHMTTRSNHHNILFLQYFAGSFRATGTLVLFAFWQNQASCCPLLTVFMLSWDNQLVGGAQQYGSPIWWLKLTVKNIKWVGHLFCRPIADTDPYVTFSLTEASHGEGFSVAAVMNATIRNGGETVDAGGRLARSLDRFCRISWIIECECSAIIWLVNDGVDLMARCWHNTK